MLTTELSSDSYTFGPHFLKLCTKMLTGGGQWVNRACGPRFGVFHNLYSNSRLDTFKCIFPTSRTMGRRITKTNNNLLINGFRILVTICTNEQNWMNIWRWFLNTLILYWIAVLGLFGSYNKSHRKSRHLAGERYLLFKGSNAFPKYSWKLRNIYKNNIRTIKKTRWEKYCLIID